MKNNIIILAVVLVIFAFVYFKFIKEPKTDKEVKEIINQNGMLGKNFSIQEMIKSNTASKLSIPNFPDGKQLANMEYLVEKILQPLRDYFGKPVIITSGFRSIALNEALSKESDGVSKTSEHMQGLAADIKINGISNTEIIKAALKLDLPFRQAIDEIRPNSHWVHISVSLTTPPKREVLRIEKSMATNMVLTTKKLSL